VSAPVDAEAARIADGYRRFADVEAAAVSPLYAELARAVAGDQEVLRFLAGMPVGKRQPNLLFAAVRFLHGVPEDAAGFRRALLADLDGVANTMLARATQTNEPARCAALLPVLERLGGPLALIEVGASAGLCLYPDRYAYRYDDRTVGGPSPVLLRCATSGDGPVPRGVPEVVTRIGIDLHPLEPGDPDDLAWLGSLIWPGPEAADRLERLAAAARIAAAEPARVLSGDLVDRLPDALALVPDGAVAVVLHTAVLPYVPTDRRQAFAALVRSLPVRWLSQEAADAVPGVREALPRDLDVAGRFVLALDARPLALTAPHGGRVDWLPGAADLLP
jgi:hypothetical protein